jgi:hypothetical protein
LIPISPKDFSVFADTTSAGLGTTKLTRLLRGNFAFGQSKYNPLWVVDQAQTSFVSVVEDTPAATFSILVEADAQGTGFLANVRAGDTRFVRIIATGPLIAGASNYKLTMDMAAKFGTPRRRVERASRSQRARLSQNVAAAGGGVLGHHRRRRARDSRHRGGIRPVRDSGRHADRH